MNGSTCATPPLSSRRVSLCSHVPVGCFNFISTLRGRFLSSLVVIMYRLVKNFALDKTPVKIYIPIGMNSETAGELGRPRAFDPAAALERAMHVFWAKGYEGASLSNLTRPCESIG